MGEVLRSRADFETRSPGEPALVFVEGEQFGRIQVERRGDVEDVQTAVTAGFRVSASRGRHRPAYRTTSEGRWPRLQGTPGCWTGSSALGQLGQELTDPTELDPERNP